MNLSLNSVVIHECCDAISIRWENCIKIWDKPIDAALFDLMRWASVRTSHRLMNTNTMFQYFCVNFAFFSLAAQTLCLVALVTSHSDMHRSKALSLRLLLCNEMNITNLFIHILFCVVLFFFSSFEVCLLSSVWNADVCFECKVWSGSLLFPAYLTV